MGRAFDPEHFPRDLQPRMFRIVLSSALRITSSRRAERLRVYYYQNRIRVLLGRLIVMTAGETGMIWLAADPVALEAFEASLRSWRRDTAATRPANAFGEAYPEYKRPPSINGYYMVAQDTDGAEWSSLRQAHFRYLDRAAELGPAPDPRSAHEPELLEQLARAVAALDAASSDAQVIRSRLSTPEDRRKRLLEAPKTPSRVSVTLAQFERNPDVVAEALYRAADTCDLCRKNAPFVRLSDGSPYLEVHHCVPLSAGGDDTIDNVIAVCPACHRELHFGMVLAAAIDSAKAAWSRRYVSANRASVGGGAETLRF